ncbi:MAG: DedA family protein [Pseudomonadota bacterium]
MDPSSILRYGSGPGAVFLACVLSGLGIPIPDDFPLLVAGWEVSTGAVPAWPTFLAGFAGVFVRDLLAFSIGYWLRRLGHLPRLARVRRSRRIAQVERLVERFGHRSLWFARYAVGMRVPLYIASGLAGDSYRRMLAVNVPGLLLTVPVTLWLGWRYGEASVAWLHRHLTMRPLLAIGVLLVTIALAVWAWRLSRAAGGGSR